MFTIQGHFLSRSGRDFFNHFAGQFSPGQSIALLGKNGVGKSTFFTSLLDGTSQARCQLSGHSVAPSQIFQHIYFHQQTLVNNFPLTAKGFLRLAQVEWQSIEREIDNFRCRSFLNQTMTRLSGGQWQRLRLTLAFASEQKILFLDEPDSHLDIEYQRLLFENIARSPKIIFFSTHNIALAYATADSFILVHGCGADSFEKKKDKTDLIQSLQKVFQSQFHEIDGYLYPAYGQ